MKKFYDVIVVGGGPAGSVAAWHAAQGGASLFPVGCGFLFSGHFFSLKEYMIDR